MEIFLDVKGLVLDSDRVRTLAGLIFKEEGQSLAVNIHVVGDEEMRALHGKHLGQDSNTDVLAFDLRGDECRACPEDLDGEVVVNGELARREALSRGHPPESELLFYVAHGLLHLLGWSDDTQSRRKAMLERQASYLKRAGHPLHS